MDIKKQMNESYDKAVTLNLSFWSEAMMDWRYYSGDQSVFDNRTRGDRSVFSFNKIRRIVNMVTGNQRKNRKQTVCVPMENADQETADQFSKLIDCIHNREYVLETLSDSFHDSLVSGISFLQIWLDFRGDPISGDIKVTKCDFNSFIIDPYFKNSDLSDCNFIWKRSYLTRDAIKSLFPNKEDVIDSLSLDSTKDGKFQFSVEAMTMSRGLLSYDEYYYRTTRKQSLLIDRKTGEVQEWRGQDPDRLEYFLKQYPEVSVQEITIPSVNLAIVASGEVLYNDINPLNIDQYPFVPIFAYYSPQLIDNNRIQGIVRGLRDAQFLYSRRKCIELDTLESQLNSGFIYKENALVDPSDVFMQGNGKGLCLKDEAQMSDIQPIIPPQIPETTIQLSEILSNEMTEISGVSEELLGTPTNDVAGLLSIVRQNSSLTTLQSLFDMLDRSQRQLGFLMIQAIQYNYAPGKVKKMIRQEPSQQFYNKAFGIYHASVEEAVLTQTQKQLQFAQLIQLREMGIAIPDDVLLDSCVLQNKNELISSIKQSQQRKQQAEQRQQELQMAQLKSQIELTQSEVVANKGMGIERMSRIQENMALAEERKSESAKDNTAALLNFVKALKELETTDLMHMEKLIGLDTMVKQREIPQIPQVPQQPEQAQEPKQPAGEQI
jgi:hypothetical protein